MDLTGQTLGVYEIREIIGRGGMGSVYRAFDSTLDRYVAVKVLSSHMSTDELFVTRFQQEAKALAKLRDPHLIHIYAVGEADGLHYFAMEFLQGITLAQFIRQRGHLPEKTTVLVLSQVMLGLYKAHEIGMVHRDIKPSNIMIDEDGRAVLMDFGLAREHYQQKLTMDGSIVGTPEYISPEQAQGGRADARSDIYALGIVLHEMLTGDVPFLGESALATLRKQIEETPEPVSRSVPNVSPGLEVIVRRALTKEPDKRYQDLIELALDLTKVRRNAALLSLVRLGKKRTGTPTVAVRMGGRKAPATVADDATVVKQKPGPPEPTLDVPPTDTQAPLPETKASTRPVRRRMPRFVLPVVAGVLFIVLAAWLARGRHKAHPVSAPPPAPNGAPGERPAIDGGQIKRVPIEAQRVLPASVKLKDGDDLEGVVESFDAETGSFAVRTKDGTRRMVAFKDVQVIELNEARQK